MHLKIHRVDSGEASRDGRTITLHATAHGGAAIVIELPAEQLDWTTGTLLSLANAAYDRQIASGAMAASNSVAPAMTCEGVKVLPAASGSHAVVQITGRKAPGAPLGMGSFSMPAEMVEYLAARLRDVSDQLTQSRRRS